MRGGSKQKVTRRLSMLIVDVRNFYRGVQNVVSSRESLKQQLPQLQVFRSCSVALEEIKLDTLSLRRGVRFTLLFLLRVTPLPELCRIVAHVSRRPVPLWSERPPVLSVFFIKLSIEGGSEASRLISGGHMK